MVVFEFGERSFFVASGSLHLLAPRFGFRRLEHGQFVGADERSAVLGPMEGSWVARCGHTCAGAGGGNR